jgi:hypothetical protein
MFAYYNRWFSLAYTVGPFRAIHYLAFAGTLYIAFSVPIIAYLKRRYPQKHEGLTRTHMFMNLLAFLLISLHFAGQIGRPANFYPELGTGLALYIAMTLQVFTGLAFRFSEKRFLKPMTNRFLHIGLALVFYIVIIVHILHGLGII